MLIVTDFGIDGNQDLTGALAHPVRQNFVTCRVSFYVAVLCFHKSGNENQRPRHLSVPMFERIAVQGVSGTCQRLGGGVVLVLLWLCDTPPAV